MANRRLLMLPHLILIVSLNLMFGVGHLHAQEWQFVSGQYFGAAYGNDGTVLVVGQRGIIMRSTDDGKTWGTPKSTTYNDLRDVVLIDQNTALAVGDHGIILRSDDAGQTWEQINIGTDSALIRLSFPTTERGYISGSGGVFFTSSDAGRTWSALLTLPELAAGLAFVNQDIGVITTSTGRIYHTTNGGQQWRMVYEDTSHQLAGIDFTPDGGFGLVGRSGGILLRTLDSGKSWSEGSIDFPLFGGKVAVAANGTVAVGGPYEGTTSTALARSEDSGRTWSLVSLPPSYTLFAVQGMALRGDGHGVVGTNTGAIYRTEDGWKTQQTVTDIRHEYPSYGLAGSLTPSFASDKIGVIPNELFPGGYIRSTDGGITWLPHNFGTGRITTAQFFSETGGLMVRESPELLIRTTNGGAEWKGAVASLTPPIGGMIQQMLFVDSLFGFQVGTTSIFQDQARGLFYRTTDGGKVLIGQKFDHPTSLSMLEFVSSSIGWIGGGNPAFNIDSVGLGYNYGTIYRTSNGGETWAAVYDRYGIYAEPTMLRFRDERHGYICVGGNDYGHPGEFVMLQTEDAGDHWEVLAVFDQAVFDMAFFNDTLWYAVGTGASIWKTTDAGGNWQKEEIHPVPKNSFGYSIGFRDIELLPDEQTVIITGPGAVVRRVFPQRVTGVNEEKNEHHETFSLSLLPNPAGSTLRLSIEGPVRPQSGPVELTIYDAEGRRVLSQQIEWRTGLNIETNVSALPAGAYRVLLHDSQSRELASEPLIIVR